MDQTTPPPTPPRPTPPSRNRALTSEAARAVIAARLEALEHPADLLDAGAIAALVDHARGSPARLRAALASTLFLASTEDAPRIGRPLVQRALQDGERQPIPGSVAKAGRGWAWQLGGAGLAAAVILGVLLIPPVGRRAPPPVVSPGSAIRVRPPETRQFETAQQPTTVSPKPGDDAEKHALPRRAVTILPPRPNPPRPAPVAKPKPAEAKPQSPAPPALLPMTPPVAVGTPPRPPAKPARRAFAPEAAAQTSLPATPTPSVLLLYPAGDPAAGRGVDILVQHLRAAGITQVEAIPVVLGRARRPISYFFEDDLGLAEKVTAVLADGGWPKLLSNSLAPRLVLPPAGLPARRPGTIEVQLP